MSFDPVLAAIRFGFGLSPDVPAPQSVEAMLAALRGADLAAAAHPIPLDDTVTPPLSEIRALNRARREARGTEGEEAAEAAYQAARRAMQATQGRMLRSTLARAITAEDAFRERLTRFWADHFSLRARNGLAAHMVTPFVETAIRPHVTGRFGDMLVAAVTHPMMIAYLDQTRSMGPNSAAAQRQDRGLNENLAREVLELHTVGVGGPYGQADVRELAELLAGLSMHPDRGFQFRADYAEPGAEEVLGATYGATDDLAGVEEGLRGIAAHPATARHIARKLAVHFVSDEPDVDLVDALAQTFAVTGGDLALVYEVMLRHPAAWTPARTKVKPPFDFVASALRALAMPVERLMAVDLRNTRRYLVNPMTAMGQTWEQPPGPDGWSERAEDWITPQGLAARIEWAMTVPQVALEAQPDPRDFVETALGHDPGDVPQFAAGAAEDRAVGIGVILASAAFQRR